MADWYYAQGGQQYGPISHANLSNLIAQGSVQPSDLVWRDGMANWLAVTSVSELAASIPQQSYAVQQAPQPQYQQPYQQPVGYYNPQGARSRGTPPPNYLVQAILVMFCCWPFAIPAIVNAAGVNSAYAVGDYAGAVAKSEAAKKWAWIAFLVGLVLQGGAIVLQIAAAVATQGGRY